MKNAGTVVRVRVAMNAALCLPPHHLPPPALPPALPPAPQQATYLQQALPQRQQAALQPPQQNRSRLQRIRMDIIHYRTSTCWFSIRRKLKRLNSLGTLTGKKVSKKPMSFQTLIIMQNELTCAHLLCMIENILLVEKVANTTIVKVSTTNRKSTGNWLKIDWIVMNFGDTRDKDHLNFYQMVKW